MCGNVTWIHPFFFLSIAGNFPLGLIIYKWYCKFWGGLDLKWVLIWGQLCMPQLILIWIFERYKLDTSYKIHCKCLQGKPIYLQVNIYFWMLQGTPIAIIFVENIFKRLRLGKTTDWQHRFLDLTKVQYGLVPMSTWKVP